MKDLCGTVLPGFAHCDAVARQLAPLTARSASAGPPYTPNDIQSAYELADKAATDGGDQTVAIVDAYDNPNAESDLAVYRSTYGLPACTTANGCFTKVNQTGGSTMPAPDSGWAGEIALDVDMVSAVCPHCKILLVETNSASMLDLFAGVTMASTLGATQISNSWGGSEFSYEQILDPTLALSVPITVSSGDDGYGVEYPAASAHVTAVGGTSLHPASNARGWSENAWDGAGSGCSKYIPKPAWQEDGGCATRTVADVSAVADPYTGVAVYNTYGGGGPWWQAGGTSAAAPIVAASYALIGDSATGPSFPYSNASDYNDVTSGTNGNCSTAYFCESFVGFDGPTGIGTPNLAGTGDGSTGVTDISGSNPPPPTPTQPVTPVNPPTAQPLRSSVLVSRSVARAARNGKLVVKITCGDGPACRGVLSLQTKIRGGGLRTLGKGKYSVGSGKTASVTIRLSHSSLSFLTKKHRLTVFGTAQDSDGTMAQSSFRLYAPKPKPKARKHRKHS
jgi:hypothetical protein